MSKTYISLQGRFYLAPIVAGVVGAMRELGNVPEFGLEIGAEVIEHNESMTGQRTVDFTMVQTTSVNFSGQLEQVDQENLKYILSGMNHEIEAQTDKTESLGIVKAGDEIKLGGYNLSGVTFTDSAEPTAAINGDKYTVDLIFGTVKFKEDIVTPVIAKYTTGAVVHTTLASNFSDEYQLFFKGINTANGDNVAVTLHRTKKSPETEFPLIHEELGSYSISGQALSDVTKAADGNLGLYGYMVTIPKAA